MYAFKQTQNSDCSKTVKDTLICIGIYVVDKISSKCSGKTITA